MATRWKFSTRWLLLLTFLVAAWSALAFSYESFLGPNARVKAFVGACSIFSALVVLTAASVAPPVARFQRMVVRPLSIEDYQWFSRRVTLSIACIAACLPPFFAIVYFEDAFVERLLTLPREARLAISVSLFATLFVLLSWATGSIVVVVKIALCRCPSCGQRLNRVDVDRESSGCVQCRAIVAEKLRAVGV
ncbi:hypothetical protein [Lacipirellula parvula]|uniref:Uncharacterized protein n=1 Tax=Lacipirellula parvula TaxID=2650471 RepID=A0A5K7XHY4_9BACT|nr:hypothetical protein [Lacipirellula parvula]BBO36490.1 hypothetical protein PLANPX_6102 [Lacipirellula parvula]